MKNRITQMNNSINKFYSILDNWKGQEKLWNEAQR